MPDRPAPSTQPQDAFEELAGITLADHTLATVMTKIAEVTKRTIVGASEVSVTLVESRGPSTVAQTGPLALQLDERQYERGHGPCLDCIDGGAPVLIRDARTEQRWPDFLRRAQEHGMGSSMSIPMPLQREVSAALNVYSTQPEAFDGDDVELGRTFASYGGVALANMHLFEAQGRIADQLQNAMRSRAVIEQAKGILMAQQRCTAEEAFDLLIAASQRANQKLREIAEAVVQSASSGRA